MLKLSILTAASALAIGTPVLAQSEQTPPPPPAPTPPPAFSNPLGTQRESVLMQHILRQRWMAADYADSIRQRAADRRSDERMERAGRLAALANAGQCRQAANVARREGDVYMLRSLVYHCGLPDRTYD